MEHLKSFFDKYTTLVLLKVVIVSGTLLLGSNHGTAKEHLPRCFVKTNFELLKGCSFSVTLLLGSNHGTPGNTKQALCQNYNFCTFKGCNCGSHPSTRI